MIDAFVSPQKPAENVVRQIIEEINQLVVLK